VFNILANQLGSLDGVCVLDLFAGSGGLGIEALSRGAAHVTFIDAARPALAAVRSNLDELGLTERALLVAGDAVALASKLTPPVAPWQLVFVDPPYRSELATRAVLAIPIAHLVAGGTIVIEHDRRNTPPDPLGSLIRTDHRRYGDTLISFYEVPA
jgi:16S rRNA (guanine966-N2)-methyltransferase